MLGSAQAQSAVDNGGYASSRRHMVCSLQQGMMKRDFHAVRGETRVLRPCGRQVDSPVNQRVLAKDPTRLTTVAIIQALKLSTTANTFPLRPQHDRKPHPLCRFSVTRPFPVIPSLPVIAMKQPPQILKSRLVQPSASLQTTLRSLRACLPRESPSSLRNRQRLPFFY